MVAEHCSSKGSRFRNFGGWYITDYVSRHVIPCCVIPWRWSSAIKRTISRSPRNRSDIVWNYHTFIANPVQSSTIVVERRWSPIKNRNFKIVPTNTATLLVLPNRRSLEVSLVDDRRRSAIKKTVTIRNLEIVVDRRRSSTIIDDRRWSSMIVDDHRRSSTIGDDRW